MNPLSGGSISQHEKELAFLSNNGENATEAQLQFNIGVPQITISLIGFGNKKEIDDRGSVWLRILELYYE